MKQSGSTARLLALVTLLGVLGSADFVAARIIVPPEVKRCVAFVYERRGNDLHAAGTGFFVGLPDPRQPGKAFSYFVTAAHVLKSRPSGGGGADNPTAWPFKGSVSLRLNLVAGDSLIVDLPIVTANPGKTVFTHPDPSVDVAVIPVSTKDPAKLDILNLGQTMLTTKEEFKSLNITEGSDVFFTGLFTGAPGQRRNYPIVRFGHVALVTPEQIPWNGTLMDLYLLETSSYGGNSGSPVFFYMGPDSTPGTFQFGKSGIRLAGIMMGTYLQNSPIEARQTGIVPYSQASNGLAAVVPAYKLREILFGPELSKRREESPISR